MRLPTLLILSTLLLLTGCGQKAPPLSIVQRDSLVGVGKVLIITNTSDDHLHECTIELSAPSGQHYGPTVFAATLKPHETVEIGWMELGEWKVEPGETVTFSAKGYRDVSNTVSQ